MSAGKAIKSNTKGVRLSFAVHLEKCTAQTARSSGSNLTGNTYMHWENVFFKLCIKAYGKYINSNLNRPIRGLVTMGRICSFINILLPSLSVCVCVCVCVCVREIKSNKWNPLLLFSLLHCKAKICMALICVPPNLYKCTCVRLHCKRENLL